MRGRLWRPSDGFGEWKVVNCECTKENVIVLLFRLSQVGVVSYGSECPSHGVYARVTEVKHWIQFIAKGAMDSNCNEEIPYQPGNNLYI